MLAARNLALYLPYRILTLEGFTFGKCFWNWRIRDRLRLRDHGRRINDQAALSLSE